MKIGKKIGRPKNIYRVAVEFMWNDADGWRTETVDVPEAQVEDKEFKDFLSDLEKMMELDRKGRGGIDNSDELHEHYRSVGVDIKKYFDVYYEDDDEDIEQKYHLSYPTDGDSGFFYSVYSINITYFDDNGDEFEVT